MNMNSKHYLHPLSENNLCDNCRIYSPDNVLMCFVSKKRVNWYVAKGLAEVIQDEFNFSTAIRLKFNPKGFGHALVNGNECMLSPKKNICVVCGSPNAITKHHVVPSRYRKYFPENIRGRNSYDIMFLCTKHHGEYEEHAAKKDAELTERYKVNKCRTTVNKIEAKVKSYANALMNYRDNIPTNRQREMETFIQTVTKKSINNETLQNLIDTMPVDTNNNSKEKEIVAKLENFTAFIQEWRNHFIKTMEPAYLPPHWGVSRCPKGYTIENL